MWKSECIKKKAWKTHWEEDERLKNKEQVVLKPYYLLEQLHVLVDCQSIEVILVFEMNFSEAYLTNLFPDSFIHAIGENGSLIEITVAQYSKENRRLWCLGILCFLIHYNLP